ncbi:MAG TPA: hypothetical protein VK467_04150 [Gemmatimonadales bacterium]|nr:hypothetical protein [Gemmatimonadales bacterium]
MVTKKPEPEAPVVSHAPVTGAVGSLTSSIHATTASVPETPNQPRTAAPVAVATAQGIAVGATHTVLLWGEGDTLTPIEVTGPRNAREIQVMGLPYDHVDTQWSTGLWIYRNDRKN